MHIWQLLKVGKPLWLCLWAILPNSVNHFMKQNSGKYIIKDVLHTSLGHSIRVYWRQLLIQLTPKSCKLCVCVFWLFFCRMNWVCQCGGNRENPYKIREAGYHPGGGTRILREIRHGGPHSSFLEGYCNWDYSDKFPNGCTVHLATLMGSTCLSW